ncbi:MAG TPA: 50S ribosomal protein L29 [Anaeromyxobacteraceae bacterium]|nr:50S ribosomal protein L29 [Anaeromyxobacteraceae bacterium]
MAAAKELRELLPGELMDRAKELRRSLFDMKSKHNTGVLDSTADLGKTRRDVARCLTIKREKELEAARAAKAAGKEKE